jgi:polygalacturonase
MGTESGGGFVDITIERCVVSSPRRSEKIYGHQRGLAGIALEIVDGGRLENVAVSNVDIRGVSVPIFLRLGNRARRYAKGAKPGVGTFRKVRLTNITAQGTSSIGCSITGVPGHPVEDVVLTNVSLGFEGGGTRADTRRAIPEREKSYPESGMFGTLPAYGFYCRHARGLTFTRLELHTEKPDLRHALVFDDVRDVAIDGLDAAFSTGAAPLIRMAQVQQATIEACSPKTKVDTLLRLEGETTGGIVVKQCEIGNVRKTVSLSREVPDGAFTQK